MKKIILLLVGSATLVLGVFVGQIITAYSSSNPHRDITELRIDYGDGSQKLFFLAGGNSLSEMFQLAKATKAGLETMVWPDRGEIEILAFEIDGLGHSSGGAWTLMRNGIHFWPNINEFNADPMNGGERIVFTFR